MENLLGQFYACNHTIAFNFQNGFLFYLIVETGFAAVIPPFNVFFKGLIDKAINGIFMAVVKIIQRSLGCKILLYFVLSLETV